MGCTESQGGLEEERRSKPAATAVTANAKSAGSMGKKSVPHSAGKLVYLELHGKAEPIRMLLSHAGVPFEDKRLSLTDRTDLNRMKQSGELPGGQVPVWIDEKGRTLNQTNALLIMLGKKYGYYGKDIWAGYEDDWALDNFGDIWSRPFYTLWF